MSKYLLSDIKNIEYYAARKISTMKTFHPRIRRKKCYTMEVCFINKIELYVRKKENVLLINTRGS